MIALRRHALARLAQAPDADSDADRERTLRWHAAGRPFVVTRRPEGSRALALGFCTTDRQHLDWRPRRVAAHGKPEQLIDLALPPLLTEIAHCPAAACHAGSFCRLIEAAADLGIFIRVYGSWMWQALTGENHVHDASDLDVLVDVPDVAAADRVAALLDRLQPRLGFRIDGEIAFPGLGEVNWREYRQGRPEVLLKSVDTMRLLPRARLSA